MSRIVLKWSISLVVAFGVILGCTSIITDGGSGNGGSGGTGGFATVDSVFSDAAPSPGGTGGVVNPDADTPAGEATRSFFTAFQIDPTAEDSAGPKFVVSGDVDQDGLTDLVSAWNQSQPVQLHLQRRDPQGNISFRTVTIAGTTPTAIMAGVELGFINGDAFPDIIVLVKATGFVTLCPPPVPGQAPSIISNSEGEIVVYFNPGNADQVPDGDTWNEMILVNPFVQDRWIHNQFPGIEEQDFEDGKTHPEFNGFTALAVGNLDGRQGDEIVVALNPGECETLGQKPPTNTVDLWINPSGAASEDSAQWGVPGLPSLSRGVPISLIADAPSFRDVILNDVDDDGDLDVVATVSIAISQNVRWVRNPLVPHNAGGPDGFAAVTSGSVPGINLCEGGVNDRGVCEDDGDCLGVDDGSCIGGTCQGGENPGADCTSADQCAGLEDGRCEIGTWWYFDDQWEERPIGQLDTGAEVATMGDVDGDGFDDIVVRSREGQIIQWFRRPSAQVVPPEFPPSDPTPDRFNFPWPVFTMTEFVDQMPEAVALGDVTGDGQLDLLAAARGAVYWIDRTPAPTVYDPWSPNTIIQDSPGATVDPSQAGGSGSGGGTTTAPTQTPGSGVGVEQVDTNTSINALLVVDLDGDGRVDVVGTLDRRTGTGLSDDRLVWYRNTRTEE